MSVGEWALLLRVDAPFSVTGPFSADDPIDTDYTRLADDPPPSAAGTAPLPDAVARVRAFFAYNDKARMAMAHYYRATSANSVTSC